MPNFLTLENDHVDHVDHVDHAGHADHVESIEETKARLNDLLEIIQEEMNVDDLEELSVEEIRKFWLECYGTQKPSCNVSNV